MANTRILKCLGFLAILSQGSCQDWGLLSKAVKDIIHPDAQPTLGMINVAYNQRDLPQSFAHMMEYVPHFVDLAKQMKVVPPGVTGEPTFDQLQEYIIAQGRDWLANVTQQAVDAGIALPGDAAGRIDGAALTVVDSLANAPSVTIDQPGHAKISLQDALSGSGGPYLANVAAHMVENPQAASTPTKPASATIAPPATSPVNAQTDAGQGTLTQQFQQDPYASMMERRFQRQARRRMSRFYHNFHSEMADMLSDNPMLTMGLLPRELQGVIPPALLASPDMAAAMTPLVVANMIGPMAADLGLGLGVNGGMPTGLGGFMPGQQAGFGGMTPFMAMRHLDMDMPPAPGIV